MKIPATDDPTVGKDVANETDGTGTYGSSLHLERVEQIANEIEDSKTEPDELESEVERLAPSARTKVTSESTTLVEPPAKRRRRGRLGSGRA